MSDSAEDMARLAQDRGHLYGDALFETVRVERGRVRWLSRHIERLRRSGAALGYGGEDGIWRVTLSRDGAAAPFGGRGAVTLRHRVMGPLTPKRLTIAPGYHFPGDRVREHKTANYLRSILARQEALDRGFDDAIMVSHDGVVGEATAANVLILSGAGAWVTPEIDGVLPGVTRAGVLDGLREQGACVEERVILCEELHECQELFLLSAGVGVIAACSLDERPLLNSKLGTIQAILERASREEDR